MQKTNKASKSPKLLTLPTFDVHVSLAEPPRIETVTICRSSSVNVESPYCGPAFCFHDWCYSVLIWKLRCHPPKSIIYKLVRTLIPGSSTWQIICEAGYQLDPVGSLQTLIAHADCPPFEPPLLLMSRLPVEVRVRIWEYVGLGTPYSAFILVAGETSRLARYVESRKTHDLEGRASRLGLGQQARRNRRKGGVGSRCKESWSWEALLGRRTWPLQVRFSTKSKDRNTVSQQRQLNPSVFTVLTI
jgi:hypothetical protein